jgi:hypothetical protein
MQNFVIQDPKTFTLPNKASVKEVVQLFFSEQKQAFLDAYFKLDNTDKFYTLGLCVIEMTNIKMAKQMFLEELRKDLETLKELNRPKTNLKFGYTYKGYNSADKSIWDRLTLEYFNIQKIKL